MSQKNKKLHINLPFMNNRRVGCAAVAHGGQIFVLGGYEHAAVKATAEKYDIASKQWTTIKSMRTPRCWCTAVSLNDSIVVMGGSDWSVYSSVEKYNLISKQWTSFSSMNRKRFGCAAAVVDGKIFVVGGRDRHEGSNGYLSCGEVYNPITREWSEIPPMNSERWGCAATVLEGHLYVMGGSDGTKIHSSAEVFNPTANQWTMITDMTTPRVGCAAVTVGGRIVIFGGSDGSNSKLSSCEAYDTTAGHWFTIAPIHSKSFGCATVEVEGTMFMLGGYDDTFYLSSLEALPHFALFPSFLDKIPNFAEEVNLDINAIPNFLSFISRHCQMITLWKVIRNRQDLLGA